jgi:hypothetical protein
MAIPIQVQLFDAFLGTQEGIHSIILPEIFSSGGSSNLYIDKFGRAKKISGYTKQNASAVVTDTGLSTVRFRGLFPYRSTAGGTVTRKLIGVIDDATDEWEIKVSSDNGATWSFLYDAGAGSINQIPDFCQFGDNLYITNGKVVPRKYNGTVVSAAGTTQSPTPAAVASANSGNLLGTYSYKLVSVFSDGTRSGGSVSSGSLSLQSKQATLSWTADADVSVIGYEIYRTTGTGTVYYFTSYIDGRATVAFTDNISDLTILENRVLEEHGDAPPTVYFCEPHKQRIWWLRTDAFPTRGYWSDPGLPESVLGDNYLEFSDSETTGDFITGALGNFEGLFVVFTERAVWTVSGTGQIIGNIVDWTRTRTNAQIGSVHHRSVVRVPAGSKYTDQQGQLQTTAKTAIAYFTPLGDIRLFDGDNDLIISHPVRTALSTYEYAQRAKIHALHDSVNDQIIWFYPDSGDGEPSKAVVWNYRYGVWYKWTPLPMSCSVEVETSSSSSTLLTGEASLSKGGYCYQFLSGNSFDGSNINAVWMTKTLYGVNEQGQPAFSNRKRWRWADFLFQVNQNVTLTVEWLPGAATDNASATSSTTIAPGSKFLKSATGSFITTATGSHILAALASAQSKALLHSSAGDYIHDEGVRLRIGDNATNGSWALEALTVGYQILPGMRRRLQ